MLPSVVGWPAICRVYRRFSSSAAPWLGAPYGLANGGQGSPHKSKPIRTSGREGRERATDRHRMVGVAQRSQLVMVQPLTYPRPLA
jgi:hypothetical protein